MMILLPYIKSAEELHGASAAIIDMKKNRKYLPKKFSRFSNTTNLSPSGDSCCGLVTVPSYTEAHTVAVLDSALPIHSQTIHATLAGSLSGLKLAGTVTSSFRTAHVLVPSPDDRAGTGTVSDRGMPLQERPSTDAATWGLLCQGPGTQGSSSPKSTAECSQMSSTARRVRI